MIETVGLPVGLCHYCGRTSWIRGVCGLGEHPCCRISMMGRFRWEELCPCLKGRRRDT